MPDFIEDCSLRNKVCVFKDRKDAGRLLAQRLSGYRDADGITLGIPSGGVPVAAEIATFSAFAAARCVPNVAKTLLRTSG